mgnify:CR=1 FL=1|tara:strand:+ start:152 stop:688 length:537 start_codon:yes stop_codon:yes gene_type:complete
MAKKKVTPSKEKEVKLYDKVKAAPPINIKAGISIPFRGLKVKLLHPEAEVPKIATPGSAGMDLKAMDLSIVTNHLGTVFTYRLGIALEIPFGFVGLLTPRSSVYKTGLTLANSIGVIDSDYRGELVAKFKGLITDSYYQPGDRVVQLVIVPISILEIKEVDKLGSTERGEGGFGSTGN